MGTAMRGLDELIVFLLEEISLHGEQGATASEVRRLIEAFYQSPDVQNPKENAKPSSREEGDVATQKSVTRIRVDDKFLAKVWGWLIAHDDIRVEKTKKIESILNGAPTSAVDTPTPKESDDTAPLSHNDDAAAPSQRSSASHGMVTSERQLATAFDQDGAVLRTTEDRIWQALTGHGVDFKRLPALEYSLLSLIGAAGPQGIRQPDLLQLSGQDKRSLPHRTDELYRKGYIEKKQIRMRAHATSLCTLRRFIDAGATKDSENIEDWHSPDALHKAVFGGEVIQPTKFLDIVLYLLKEVGTMSAETFRKRMGLISKHWERRASNTLLKYMQMVGCIRRLEVSGRGANLTQRVQKVLKSISYVQDPTPEARTRFQSYAQRDNRYFTKRSLEEEVAYAAQDPDSAEDADNVEAESEDDDAQVGQVDELSSAPPVESNVQITRIPPRWDPARPLLNLLYEVADAGGAEGISSMEFADHATGAFWKRPLDHTIAHLTDVWQEAQPPHLRHLAIVRDTAVNTRSIHYLYRTHENFGLAAEAGVTSWDAVNADYNATNKKNNANAHSKSEQLLDSWGFPTVKPSTLFGRHGIATPSESRRATKFDAEKPLAQSFDEDGNPLPTSYQDQLKKYVAYKQSYTYKPRTYTRRSTVQRRVPKKTTVFESRCREQAEYFARRELGLLKPVEKRVTLAAALTNIQTASTTNTGRGRKKKMKLSHTLTGQEHLAIASSTVGNSVDALASVIEHTPSSIVESEMTSSTDRQDISGTKRSAAIDLNETREPKKQKLETPADIANKAELEARVEKIRLELLSLSRPGVYVNPPSRMEPHKGRPLKKLVMVFKHEGLRRLGWFGGSPLAGSPVPTSAPSMSNDDVLVQEPHPFDVATSAVPEVMSQENLLIQEPHPFEATTSAILEVMSKEDLLIPEAHPLDAIASAVPEVMSTDDISTQEADPVETTTSAIPEVTPLRRNRKRSRRALEALVDDVKEHTPKRGGSRSDSRTIKPKRPTVQKVQPNDLNAKDTSTLAAFWTAGGPLVSQSKSNQNSELFHIDTTESHKTSNSVPLTVDEAPSQPIHSMNHHTPHRKAPAAVGIPVNETEILSRFALPAADLSPSVRLPTSSRANDMGQIHDTLLLPREDDSDVRSRATVNPKSTETSNPLDPAHSHVERDPGFSVPDSETLENVVAEQRLEESNDQSNVIDVRAIATDPIIPDGNSLSSSLLPEEQTHKKRPAYKRKAGVLLGAGTLNKKRTQMIMQIMEQAGGVYPGDREMWYPFVTAVRKVEPNSNPDPHTVTRAVKSVVATGKVRKIAFAFADRGGATHTRHILVLPSISMESEHFKAVQRKITEFYPRPYIPEEVEIDADYRIHIRKEDVRRKEILAQKLAAEQATLEAAAIGGRMDGILGKITGIRRTTKRVSATKKASTFKSSFARQMKESKKRGPKLGSTRSINQISEREPAWRMWAIEANVEGAHKLPKPSAADNRREDFCDAQSEDEDVDEEQAVMQSVFALDNYSHNPKTAWQEVRVGRARRYQKMQNWHKTEPQPDPHNLATGALNSIAIPRAKMQRGVAQIVRGTDPKANLKINPRAWIADPSLRLPASTFTPPIQVPQPRTILFSYSDEQQTKAAKNLERSENLGAPTTLTTTPFAPVTKAVPRNIVACLTLTDPDQTLHGPSGTFSTQCAVVRRQRPQLSIDPNLQRNFEEKLLASLELVAPHVEDSSSTSDNIGRSSFESEVNRIQLWEADNEKLLTSRKSLIQPHFVNHTIPNEVADQVTWIKTEYRGPGAVKGSKRNTTYVPRSTTRAGIRRPYKTRKTRQHDPTLVSEDVMQSSPKPPVKRVRGPRNVKLFSDVQLQRFMTAVVVVRSLIGGNESIIKWTIIGKLMPDFDKVLLKQRWNAVRVGHSIRIKRMECEFHEAFLTAYENNAVPQINYNDLENYDWESLVTWAQTQMTTFVSLNALELPADRNKLDQVHLIQKAPDAAHLSREDLYFSIASDKRRVELLHSFDLSLPMDQPRAGHIIHRADVQDVVKSYVRANVFTPEEGYNGHDAAEKLEPFSEEDLDGAITALLNTKLFRQENKGRPTPGRNFGVSDQFYSAFKRQFDLPLMFHDAVKAKLRIDAEIASLGYSDVSYHSQDAEVMVTMNLFAGQLIDLQPMLPSITEDAALPSKNPDTGERVLSMWGFTQSYKTRVMDRANLTFTLRIKPRESYPTGIPLPSPLPDPPAPHLSDVEGKERRIPVWYDIHDKPIQPMWEMLVASMITMVVLRPGCSEADIVKSLRNKVELWEIKWVVSWLVDLGVVRKVRTDEGGIEPGGLVAMEWWWAVFGSGTT